MRFERYSLDQARKSIAICDHMVIDNEWLVAVIDRLVDALEQYEDIPIYKVAGIDTSGPEPEEIENEEYVAQEALSIFKNSPSTTDEEILADVKLPPFLGMEKDKK